MRRGGYSGLAHHEAACRAASATCADCGATVPACARDAHTIPCLRLRLGRLQMERAAARQEKQAWLLERERLNAEIDEVGCRGALVGQAGLCVGAGPGVGFQEQVRQEGLHPLFARSRSRLYTSFSNVHAAAPRSSKAAPCGWRRPTPPRAQASLAAGRRAWRRPVCARTAMARSPWRAWLTCWARAWAPSLLWGWGATRCSTRW